MVGVAVYLPKARDAIRHLFFETEDLHQSQF